MDTSFNAEFARKVKERPGGENISLCYACGTCTACCPVAALRAEFNPRKIIRQVQLGRRGEVLGSPEIWLCAQCHACTALCPQDARFAGVVRVLRELAVENGFVPPDTAAKTAGIEEGLKKERLEKLLSVL